MGTEQRCSTCGKALEANAPGGLCPECLIKVGLGSGVDIGPEIQTGAARPAFVPPAVGKLAGKFPQLEVLELIGKGGMGAVYKARQRELDRIVALKILPPDVGQDAAFAERFTREARALAKLNHPGIVTLYEFGRADGLYFFLMEYVDGVNLRRLLAGGRVSSREALAIVPQICDALQYAHDQGIVRRDIKPENILLDRRGRVKVADFGLAKIIGNQNEEKPSGGESAPASSPLSDASKVMGTPQYMSPEQISAPGEVDHRADIYALGVVFYQMLTGELPGKPIEAPSKKVKIDVRLDEVVLHALEQKPELRYQQASVLKTQIETIASTPAGAPAMPPNAQKPPPGNFSAAKVPWQIWVVVAVLGLEGLGDLATIQSQPPALFWLASKCLFAAGLLLGWWPIFVLFLSVAGYHAVYFAGSASLVALMNLALVVLTGTAFRFYFTGKRLERQRSAGKLDLVIGSIAGAFVVLSLLSYWQRSGLLKTSAEAPVIESVVVSTDKAVVKQRHFHGEGMDFTFGPMTNRWEPNSAYFDHLFDVTLEWPWFRRDGANWVIKSRHGTYSDYILDGPPGPMHGKIVFHPGTPAPEADGSYVIGEFQPENGKPLPIAVRLVRNESSGVRAPQTKADAPTSEAMLRQIQAARVELPYAEAELARLTKLHSSNVITDQAFSEAQYKVEELKAESKGDEAEVWRIRLRQAEENLARLAKLHSSNAISDQDYEQAELKVKLLRAQSTPIPVPSQSTNQEREHQ